MAKRASKRALPEVTITTDGSARGNPGPGGWAALIEHGQADGATFENLISGEEPTQTTNNAMEIQAVTEGLLVLKEPHQVLLRIDSEYVIDGIEKILRGVEPGRMKNPDRWTALANAIAEHQIELTWVEAHAGDDRNERVDTAATAAANRAYDQAEASRRAQAGDQHGAWGLFVRTAGGGQPVEWLLRTDTDFEDGAVEVTPSTTEPAAAWASVVEGLEAALERGAGRQTRLVVRSNLELIIKQGRGEWKVKNAALQSYYDDAFAIINDELGDVQFEWLKTAELLKAMNE